MAGKRNVGTTERGSLIMSGRLSVLEQLERTIKSDRPWEKEAWTEKDKPHTPSRGKVDFGTPPFSASKIDSLPVGRASGGIMKNGNGGAHADKNKLRPFSLPPPLAINLDKNHLPGSLEQCHDLILDLKEQLRATEMLDRRTIEKKEQTIEGISDLYSAVALMPEQQRLFREYNEMKEKYEANLYELTRVQEELDQARISEGRLKSALAQAHASKEGVDESSARVLKAEEIFRDIQRQRFLDAEASMKAVQAARQESQAELKKAQQDLEDARKKSQEGHVSRLFEAEMDSLKAKLARKEADIKVLQTEYAKEKQEMVAEIDSLKLELAKARNNLAALKDELASEATQIAISIEREQATRDKVSASLVQEYQKAQAQIRRLSEEKAELKKALEDLEDACKKSQQGQESRFEADIDTLKADLVRKEADIKVLQTEHAKEKEKMVAEMDSLKIEVAMARKDLSALQIDREAVQKTEEELASDAKRQFEVDMESLRAKLLRKEADIKVLQTGYAEEKEKMAAEIDSLKLESARNRKDLNDASYHAAAAAATDEKLAHMASVFSERENNFSKEKESLTQEIGELKRMLADIEAKRIQWLSAEDARRSEDSEARKREEGARKQLEEMSKEIQHAKSQLRSSEEKATRLESALNSTNITIERQMEEVRSEHAVKLARLEQQLIALEESKRRLEDELERERKQRLADKQMALDNAICDVNEERKRSERELESQRRRNADELQAQDAANKRKTSELQIHLDRERITAQTKMLEAQETLREESARRRELEEDLARLKREVDALQNHNQHVAHRAADVQQRLLSTEDALSQLKQQLDVAHEQNSMAEEAISVFERDIEKAITKIQTLEEALEQERQVAEAANTQVQQLNQAKHKVERALEASQGDNAALRERLKEDSRARAEDQLAATRAMEEALHASRASREREQEQHESFLAQLEAQHRQTLQKIKEEHGTEVETILEDRASLLDQFQTEKQKCEEEIACLQELSARKQTELADALQMTERLRHAERENLEQQLDEAVRVAREEALIGEGQACEALEIVAAEMAVLRNHCTGLEEQLQTKAAELEEIVEDHERLKQGITHLQRTQTELEAALARSNVERESEELQAHEAMSIVAAEMTALRNECASLEEQLVAMKKDKVLEAKHVLNLNMLLEEQAHEHEHAQGQLKSALKVADEDIEKLKAQYRKLQDELSIEKALRERDREAAEKELKLLALLQIELKARDDRLESMRNEALMLKAEVLSTSSPCGEKRLSLAPERLSLQTPHKSQRNSLVPKAGPFYPPVYRDSGHEIVDASEISDWQAIMSNGQDKLSGDEMLLLAKQQKSRIEQLFSKNVKREMADIGKDIGKRDSREAPSAPSVAVLVSWQTLLVLLGNDQVKEALDAGERSSFRGDTWGGAQYMEWHALRKLINVNPPQFDKASVLFLMEQHIPGSADVGEAGGWELHDRLRRARDLLRGIKYEECKAEAVCIAALYEWNTLVLDMYRLCNEHGLHS